MTSSNDIRARFLGFFRDNSHAVVASSPLVPHNDPTLLFVNSGMVQFKNVFTGTEKRPYTRAVTAQKCVRAGGKHNDLDNVGYTTRHHTFFEMLGNFSFGDYFKERAIELAWKLVHHEFGLPSERLIVTVFHEDDEAFALWRRIAGLPEQRIVRIATKDNFWSMGDTGPCGPCSEIFYDHGPAIAGGPPGSADGDRWVEIWNLVFMQYEQVTPAERVNLPRPSIDTGMGLERVAAVLQGVHDNYETDTFRTLIAASEAASGVSAAGPHAGSHKVVADHLRAASFLVADGVLPSNEGRGYVLRRIMRRAMRHAHMMGCRDPLLWRLVPALVGAMGAAYPELVRAQPLVTETLKLEEVRFRETLERGLRHLDDALADLPSGKDLPGDVAFKLYDTYGFPLDLTEDALRAQGRKVDTAGFDAAMQRQRAAARAAWAGSGEQATERVWFEVRERAGATEFLGYAVDRAEAKVVALISGGKEVSSADAGQDVAVVVNQTPFYGESGGQMGDTGVILGGGGARVEIGDTQKKLGALHVHQGCVEAGRIAVGDDVRLTIDGERRRTLRSSHSATHLLHQALRRRLGGHVVQKGSLVAPDRLRFDFSHPKPVAPDELAAIEADVNRQIQVNVEVGTRLMTPDEAVKAGALALFGEKYGDEVRVVAMGEETDRAQAGHNGPVRDHNQPYSVELCGGTHVRRTGDIGLLHIVGEGAVAAGVRRIEALTGDAARQHLATQENRLGAVAALLRVAPAEVPDRVAALVDERKRLERELADARRKLSLGGGAPRAAEDDTVRTVAGVKLVAQQVADVPAKDLKGLVDAWKQRIGSGIVALVSVADGKAALVAGVTDDLTDRYDAVALVKAGAAELGGKGGGGRRDMAQAGGPDVGRVQAALAAIEHAIAKAPAAA